MYTFVTPDRRMTDIHMHLVPGMDDGAVNLEMALEMMARAKEQGISRIIATPHSDAFYDARNGKRIFRQLTEAAAEACPEVKLYLGCEVFCVAQFMDSVMQALASGQYPTMNGTNCVLMEFAPSVLPEQTVPCVKALAEAGYIPIIAHMERYRHLQDNMELVDRFLALGAMIQVNAYSLSDEKDASIKNWARRLVRERRAAFLGTDAHRMYHRPPCAAGGLQWLYGNADREYADAIAWGNAEKWLGVAR